ncbi:MAG: inositol monophosphatase [Firmicutes bacterium]|nr:inositol monophosphatase family protein [Bacillota bacterium]NLL87619.1 inositol monophosphatase [Bacillota bacterium]HKM17142.1 inositol monophosphatase family protein [Limnochordia bacterium]
MYKLVLEYAKDLAYAAGKILREQLKSGFSIEYKGQIDLITDADKASEELLTRAITRAYPEHAILTEEGGKLGNPGSDYLWVIDPLDGTTNFAHRLPYFSVSIALLEKSAPVAAVVYAPSADEMFSAAAGSGAWLNDHPIKVSKTSDLKASLLCTGFPYDLQLEPNNLANYAKLVMQTQGVLRLGSAALDLCYVACGRLDGFWEFHLNPWDMAAGALIAREAGAAVSGITKPEFDLSRGEIIATNGLIHKALLDQLRG